LNLEINIILEILSSNEITNEIVVIFINHSYLYSTKNNISKKLISYKDKNFTFFIKY